MFFAIHDYRAMQTHLDVLLAIVYAIASLVQIAVLEVDQIELIVQSDDQDAASDPHYFRAVDEVSH